MGAIYTLTILDYTKALLYTYSQCLRVGSLRPLELIILQYSVLIKTMQPKLYFSFKSQAL